MAHNAQPYLGIALVFSLCAIVFLNYMGKSVDPALPYIAISCASALAGIQLPGRPQPTPPATPAVAIAVTGEAKKEDETNGIP